ncbi:MAG: HDIG domain-containing metalloprotein [Pyrinomonadaceae bacterium]
MAKLPENIKALATAVREHGGRAMLVGGCVRDEIMGIVHKDWDVEVYGVDPTKLRVMLDSIGEVNVVGEAFAVYKIGNDLDVSIPRRERKVSRGHRGFVVGGDAGMSFGEACARRDFTINAILKDALTGEIVDPFYGQVDIQRKVLRMVSRETFADDSLRVLRAAQFAARFEFEIEVETVEVCSTIDVTDLPKERIWGEFEKLMLKSQRPSVGLKWLYDLGVVAQIFPEMHSLVGVPQEPDWHPEGDVDVHTMMVVDEARKLIDELDHPRQVAVMLGALAHDFGKPATTEFIDGKMRSRGHDEAGVEPTLTFLDTLGLFTLDGYDARNQIVQLVRYHLKPGEYYKSKSPVGDGAFRRLARKVESDLLYRVAKADSLGRNPDWLPKEKWFDSDAQEWFIEKVRELQIEKRAPDPILMGRHLIELGLEPSPEFKRILDAVYEMQLDGQITSLADAIASARSMI